jgi:BirA family biotin operon repressor/biotin-[acetyl-CoA-carboxylase] ligase
MLGRIRLHYPVLGSTNDLAHDLLRAGWPHGTLVLADRQTAGRGRGGRRWEAAPGAALLCSLLLRPDLPAARAPLLMMAAALATADAATGVTGRPAALKWPNDVLLATAAGPPGKAAGILVETTFAGATVTTAVLGIGINVAAHPPHLPATDLSAVAGRPVARSDVLTALLESLERWLARLAAGDDTAIFAAWRSRLITLGQSVQVATAGETYPAVAEAVAPDGALLVRLASGELRRLTAAEVTLSHGRP